MKERKISAPYIVTMRTSLAAGIPSYNEFRMTLRAIHGLIFNPDPNYKSADLKIASLTSAFNIHNTYYSIILFRYVYLYNFGTENTDREQVHPSYQNLDLTSLHSLYNYLIFLSNCFKNV